MFAEIDQTGTARAIAAGLWRYTAHAEIRASILEVVVVGSGACSSPLWCGRWALQELWGVLSGFAFASRFTIGTRLARRPLRRVAADLRLQFDDVEKYVRLSAQFVGDHWRLGGDG